MTSLQRQRQLQSSYIVPDQTRHIELVVGQILEIEFENSCPFCVLRKSRNPELSGDTKSTNSFEPNSVLSNFGMSKVAPIGVFPRKYFNRSNFGIPKVARNEDVFEGFGPKIVSGSPKFAQNEDVFEGFGPF